MNIPSIDGAHYSTSRVDKKKKKKKWRWRGREALPPIFKLLWHFSPFFVVFNVSRITRCLSFPRDTDNETSSRLQRRFLESRDTKGRKSANSTNVDVFLFSSRYKREREREREIALKGNDAAYSFAYQPAKRFSKYRRDRALPRQITVRFTFDGSFEPRGISSLG